MAPSVVLVVAVAALALAWIFGVVRMFTGADGGGTELAPARVRSRGAPLPAPRSPSFPG